MFTMRARGLAVPFACVIALAVAQPAGGQANTGVMPANAFPFIESSGTGEVRVAPNRATVVLGVETHASSAAAATAANARLQRAVIDTLRAMGLDGSSISTSDFTVSPEDNRDRTKPPRTGYIARNVVSVEVATLSRLGAIIDAALARGSTMAGRIEFGTSAADSAKQAALAAAAGQANRQAATLAAALGGSLGPLVQATTNARDNDYMELGYGLERMRAPYAIATPIVPGDLTIRATILARWRFIPR